VVSLSGGGGGGDNEDHDHSCPRGSDGELLLPEGQFKRSNVCFNNVNTITIIFYK